MEEEKESEEELVDGTLHDCVVDFVYYDRKEDEDLPRERIEAFLATEAGRAFVVERFTHWLNEATS
jgi:hypothetical protein